MIPIILAKRKSKVRSGRTFNKLITYIEGNSGLEKLQAVSQDQKFEDILNYTTSHQGKQIGQEKCIAIRTHGVTDISSAAAEMNAASARNARCKNPAFHFVLTWPENEHPHTDLIFEAAEHAIKSLGLADHQFVLAVHVNTDNIHCHAAVNRIHPDTYKSRNIEWANKTIHLSARQSEIRHGWANDNGIYIVTVDEQNNKSIVLNPDHDHTIPHAIRDHKQEIYLPIWHDPDSLDSWLKNKVAKALKHALPTLESWYALHVWLGKHDITLADSGGGGMRLHATSEVTGEVINLPASKGLRILKRIDLENRWGKFTNDVPTPCIVPDFSHQTPSQIEAGVNRFLKSDLDHGIPPDHIIHPVKIRRSQAAATSVGLETDKTDSRGSLKRDNSKREERSGQRAAARADLRQRFSQYQRFVREGDVDNLKRTKEIRAERSQSLKAIRDENKAEKLAINIDRTTVIKELLSTLAAIDFESSRRKLGAESVFQEKSQSLRVIRLPSLGWREWLYEQSNLGDQAAISALRGIVYQAQRDAKRGNANTQDSVESEKETDTEEYSEQQYHKVMARLLEEEKKEVAIRSARSDAMRPYEVDALLIRYVGMQWRVTGNGNITYSDQNGGHLFTDRGNRVTFDRVRVSDEDIRLALIHAQQKFGKLLTLTGDDPVFTARMACLADDMGMMILNPELQSVIANHREDRVIQDAEAQRISPTLNEPTLSKETESPSNYPKQREDLLQEPIQANKEEYPIEKLDLQTSQERLRAMVLEIDPRAEFVIPDISDSHTILIGPVAIAFTAEGSDHGFAQHLGRGVYALHPANAPEHHNNFSIEIQYRDGLAVATVPVIGKGKAR